MSTYGDYLRRRRNVRALLIALYALIFVAGVAIGRVMAQQGPPPGSPFPPAAEMPKLALLADVMTTCRSWGWTDVETLTIVAWALRVDGWNLTQGVGPILRAIP